MQNAVIGTTTIEPTITGIAHIARIRHYLLGPSLWFAWLCLCGGMADPWLTPPAGAVPAP